MTGVMQYKSLLALITLDFFELNEPMQKQVYDEFYNLVYGIIIFMVKDHAAAEDIIQEAFMKVVRNKPAFESEKSLIAWLKVVTKNTIYNYLRKNKKHRNEVTDERVFNYISENYASSDSLEGEVEAKMMADTIHACLNQIKPEYKALVQYRWQLGLSYREIAAEMETTEETVRHKLYRARQAIKKKFMQKWGDHDDE